MQEFMLMDIYYGINNYTEEPIIFVVIQAEVGERIFMM